jgi:6-pyruvoyltetrahydropterin/6-carboxytetrahydropterin synthase
MTKQDRLNATFKLWKDFTFEAAHQLTKVPVGHQCGRLHGHSYKLRIHCQGKLNPERDWVVDYADIAAATKPIVQQLDHTLLNDHFDFETTAENIAFWVAGEIKPKLASVYAVELFETPTTSVVFEL